LISRRRSFLAPGAKEGGAKEGGADSDRSRGEGKFEHPGEEDRTRREDRARGTTTRGRSGGGTHHAEDAGDIAGHVEPARSDDGGRAVLGENGDAGFFIFWVPDEERTGRVFSEDY